MPKREAVRLCSVARVCGGRVSWLDGWMREVGGDEMGWNGMKRGRRGVASLFEGETWAVLCRAGQEGWD